VTTTTSSHDQADEEAATGPSLQVPGVPARRPATVWWRRARTVAARAGSAVLVLWLAATAVFFLARLVPGDPVMSILGVSGAAPSPELIAATRAEHGLDRPVLVQYASYLGGLVQGDLGMSYQLKRPVADVIGEQVAPTVQLTVAALVLAWLLALASILLTAGRSRPAGAVGRLLEVVLASVPHFWVGIMLLTVFAAGLGWFPVAGGTGTDALVLPALTMALPLAGFLAQVTRESYTDALEQPFALTSRARGARETTVRLRHALRHAVVPGLTLSGWAVGSLLSGAVVAEVVFARPGIGRALVDAISARDLPVVLAVVVLAAVAYVVVNLVVDAVSRVVDPRLAGARS
jgi:peptide/nickel transport system permease protein